MTHESDTSALGSATEEGNLGLLLAESVGVELHGVPCGQAAGGFVIRDGGEVDSEASISLDNASPADLQQGNQGGTKVSGIDVSKRAIASGE